MSTQRLTRRLASVAIVVAVSSLAAPTLAGASASPAVALLKPAVEGKLNINTATASQWAMLPGIGPTTAEKLVAYRQRHPFRRVSQIMRIKGVGQKTFAAIRPFLTLTGETTLRLAAPSPDITSLR